MLLTVLEPETGEGVGSGLEEEAKGNFPSLSEVVARIFHIEDVSTHHLGKCIFPT